MHGNIVRMNSAVLYNGASLGHLRRSATGLSRSSALVRLRRMQIDTYQSPVIYLQRDCGICRSEGFESQSRIEVRCRQKSIIATLNVVSSSFLQDDEAGLSEFAWKLLEAEEGDAGELRHPEALDSLSALRAKVYGVELESAAIDGIVHDIARGLYSDLELAAFITACAGDRMSLRETIALTKAMVNAGEVLKWSNELVVDKHCIGGLPGNRTTPIVVAIVAASGLCIPKTSSRAITSPAGTADVMETLTAVDLTLESMRRVVELEGGCLVWGGAVSLSPADDALIRVERPLDFDSESQMVASVLSKKIAAGAGHVLLDLPVGPSAKVRTQASAGKLTQLFEDVGKAVGLTIRACVTDGAQPVGKGIGPALEAMDVLAVLQGTSHAPADLRERAVALAARLIEVHPGVPVGEGMKRARHLLDTGQAWKKFQAICKAQGGLKEPPSSRFHHVVESAVAGRIVDVDNRALSRLAKLAGAPRAPAAGVEILKGLHAPIAAGEPLLRLHAESAGELAYALDYLSTHPSVIAVGGHP